MASVEGPGPDAAAGGEEADGFAEVSGRRVFVRRWTPDGADGAAPVLMLHDSLGCVDLWRDFPAMLAGRLRRPVVAYDRPGFGRSDPRHDAPSVGFVREEAETVLPALRAALGIERHALFGHSVGGAMALLAAAAAPDACEAVVTVSAQAFVEERTRQGIRDAQRGFDEPGAFERLARWHGERARWVLDAWTGTWLSPAFARWSIEADLPRVHCPVLAVHGDRDEYGSSAFPETIRRLSGGHAESAILADTGHLPHRERPEAVLDQVVRFLDGAAGGTLLAASERGPR